MDVRLTPSEEQFADELRRWLDGVTPPDDLRDFGATPTAEDVPAARAWHRMLAEGGWVGLSWPAAHGGRDATPIEQAIFAEEMAARELPRQLNFVTMELAGPAIVAHGNARQQEAHLAPILKGDEIWCQLFSEPEAGSDLAGLAARAVEDGDGWRVSGQKVWTSGAHYADLGLLLARTSDASKHGGITCFLLPMDRDGISVRPITQMDGESKFNEVFLDEVRVEPDELLGEVGGGWSVALSILGRERRMLGSIAIGLARHLTDLRTEAAAAGVDGPVFQERWSLLWTRVRLLRWTWLRYLSSGGRSDDPRTSVLKLTASHLQQDVARFAVDVLGPAATRDDGLERWGHQYLATFGATIAGGTSEIQKNILAARVLDLPR